MALSLTVLPTSAAQINASDYFEPLPSVGVLDSSNYSSGYHFGYSSPFELYGSSVSGSVYLGGFQSGSVVTVYAFAYESGAQVSFYNYKVPNPVRGTASINGELDGLNGYYVQIYAGNGDPVDFNIPIYDSGDALIEAFADAPSAASSAVLVSPGDDYQYLTSKTLTNSSSSSVAVGWVGETFYVSSLDPNVTLQNIETTFYLRLFDTDTQLYYSISGLVGTESDIIGPVFESTSDYFASALDVLTGSGTSTAVSGTSQTFTLAPGYVGYLHLTDPTADINLSANFNTYSKLGVSGSAWDANITYLFGTTLPYGSREFPRSEASYVYWMKNAGGSTNLLGQTKSGGAVLHPTGNLIEIYNPYYQQSGLGHEDDGNGSVVLNPTIHGETTGGIMSWVVYPVEDNFSHSNFAGVVSKSKSNFADPTSAQDDGTGNFDPHVTPGGSNDPVNDDTVQGILNSFLNRFFGLFSSGHSAIRSLIDGSSEFVSQLSGLYAWLPPPVLSVLTSAIVLAITIGVLKVLL